jgi:hypothetical protein
VLSLARGTSRSRSSPCSTRQHPKRQKAIPTCLSLGSRQERGSCICSAACAYSTAPLARGALPARHAPLTSQDAACQEPSCCLLCLGGEGLHSALLPVPEHTINILTGRRRTSCC